MSDNSFNVAVVGATGAVGEAMISILEERNFPVNRLYPLASERSAATAAIPRQSRSRPVPTMYSLGEDVFVGRIREDISHPNGLNLWAVSDNLRKGAALNSVQIAEILVKDYL